MQTMTVNGVSKKCAFCKYWYDPTNAAIRPKAPQIGLWEYDPQAENICTKNNRKRKGMMTGCSDYKCKIPK